MTVKVLSDFTAAAVIPQEEVVPEKMPDPQKVVAPAVYETVHTIRKKRATGGLGDVLFVQLLLSVLLSAGLWAGLRFGSEEIKAICAGITELFR